MMVESAPGIADYVAHLQRYLEHTLAQHGVPGACLEIRANGRRLSLAAGVLQSGGERMSGNMRFSIGRSNGLLSALAFLELVALGKADLDVPIQMYLPELSGCAFGTVTCWQLLTDTAGFSYARASQSQFREGYGWEDLVSMLKLASPIFQPGVVYSRTLEARAILSEIHRRQCGRSAVEAAKDIVTRLQAGPDDDGKAGVPSRELKDDPKPDTSRIDMGAFWRTNLLDLRMSAGEFIRMVETIIADRNGSSRGNVSSATARELQRTVAVVPCPGRVWRGEAMPDAVALGCHEFGRHWMGLNGPMSDQSFSFRYHTVHDLAVVVVASANCAGFCETVLGDVIRSLLPEEGNPTDEAGEETIADRELAGLYLGTSGQRVRIVVHDDEVICELLDRSRKSPVTRLGASNRWVDDFGGKKGHLGFFRPGGGQLGLFVGLQAFCKIG